MPRRSTITLTKKLIDGLSAKADGEFIVWDHGLPGFGVRVKETGTKIFIVKYRSDTGVQRKLSLGRYGAVTVEHARRLAMAELGKVADGQDPGLDAKRARQAQTVAQLCDRYMAASASGQIIHRGKPKKESTVLIDRGRIERHIKPLLGSSRIDAVTRQDVHRMMQQIREGGTAQRVKTGKFGLARVTGGGGTAKKAVMLLSAIYNYALREGLADHNPCQHVPKPIDNRRTRFLNAEEYARIGAALDAAEGAEISAMHANAIRALLLTGCRKSEILKLKRAEVDLGGRCLRFEDTKTGAQIRPCGDPALTLIQSVLNGHESSWAFPASRSDGALEGVRKPLEKVCALAGVQGVTAHVFRHSFATVAHEIGYSELTIAGLLGHRLHSMTSRYAHHVDHALADAADKVSLTISRRLKAGLAPKAGRRSKTGSAAAALR